MLIESVGGVDAARRVEVGERIDVVVLAAGAIQKLAAVGRVLSGTEREVANSSVAIAVRSGATRPDISTEDALRTAVLSARSVGYSTGPSGIALQGIFNGWGVTESIRSRLVQAPAGVPVGILVARGDVEIGFQQLSELMNVEGVDVVGPMPRGLEILTTFSGAVCMASGRAQAAHDFLDFVVGPDVAELKVLNGMQPPGS